MKIQFYLRFHTTVGQSIFVTGSIHELGNGDYQKALPLQYLNNDFWQLALDIDLERHSPINYSYLLKNNAEDFIAEWGNDRQIEPPETGETEEIQLIDTWNHAGEFENAFYSAPFRDTLLSRHKPESKKKGRKSVTHIFKVKAPLLKKDEVACISGNSPVLGDWNTEDLSMLHPEGNWWVARLELPKESFPLSYKYGVYNTKTKTFVRFENGENRLLHGDAHNKKLCVLHDGFIHLPNNTWRGTGVAIPVFSLRSKKSLGVGEFSDISLLVDWAKKTGLKLIQILPINDTSATLTWLDSYPYAAISAFALHPIYLNLEKMAGKKQADKLKGVKKIQKQLNELPDLDYEQVIKIKLAVAKEIFEGRKDEWQQDEDYLAFFEKNKHWLVPYAAFCCLRDHNGTADFSKWKMHSKYDRIAIQKFAAPRTRHYDEIAVQYFIQYHLHLQLREVTEYAHKNGIVLKGDIPIGIYRHSCDAWIEPRLYHLDVQAGAPPDDFAVRGQNWGFPTYNWAEMELDGFAWWKKRFEQMAEYFDAFRIDHILGFFRIWSIPMSSAEGLLGNFDPVLPVHLHEFQQRNIWFDYNRYVRPFINDAVLWEYFGNESDFVKSVFLDDIGEGIFLLKEPFDTQRKVEAYFETQEKNEYNSYLRKGLWSLIANVVLLEVPGSHGTQFNFRIAMEQTPSFRYLEWTTQQQLKNLYVDYFFRRQDQFWKEDAMRKLPRLKRATNMLVCGEDLGMVPACVPDVIKQLGILSLEIQRMPKDPSREFFHPADAPYLSVVTPSTHDMSTIRGWWEEDRGKTQRFFNQDLGQWGDAPWFCEAWINKAIVIQHLYSPAMWSIFQLQDLLGIDNSIRRENPNDERINIPANPKNYWKYRLHLTLEELIHLRNFNEELRTHISASGR